MHVYSEKIIQFVKEITHLSKQILSQEIGLKVRGSRFYDERGTTSYPIKVVIFNHKNLLGYFDAEFYEMGLHERLMYVSKEQLGYVIRHELAHYLTFVMHGQTLPHGVEFREFCARMGWGENIYRATFCLEEGHSTLPSEESGVLRKVQKLMALANSSNAHEAEQAMLKSQQLLLKHHIEAKYLESHDEDKVLLKRILKQKRETAKMRAIAQILETFFVNVVYNRTAHFICLEILGTATNIEIAEYIAAILQTEFETLWSQAQKQAHLKGVIAKNSFLLGIAKGYCNKIQALKRTYASDVSHAVMLLENQLQTAKALAYPRLTSKRSSATYCPHSASLGEQMGKALTLHPALKTSPQPLKALLSFFN